MVRDRFGRIDFTRLETKTAPPAGLVAPRTAGYRLEGAPAGEAASPEEPTLSPVS